MGLNSQKKNIISLILFLALAAGFFYFGWQGGLQQAREKIEKETGERHGGGFKFISPLLECQSPSAYDNSLSKLEEILNRYIEDRVNRGELSHVSIYLRDLNNGPWIGINSKEKFSPASLMKVPILVAYLKSAETRPGYLETRLEVTADESQVFSQNIIPSKKIVKGQEYTINELLERMIMFSDNLAAITLLENINTDVLEDVYKNFGIGPLLETDNVITVKDYASFFRILYNASYLSREMSEKALSILSQSEFHHGLAAGLPSGLEIAHKFGERKLSDSLQLHDCGIVYNLPNPYLICVMTRGNDFDNLESAIGDISQKTFDYFQGLNE